VEVDLAIEQSREVGLVVDEGEARRMAGLVLDEDVEVAVGPEVVAQDGAEQGEAADVALAAEIG
jgi:hypothetical protein